jgi:hypothetical protein
MDPVADHRTDAETPHLAGGVGDDPVIVVERHSETAIGENLVDQPFDGEQFFLGQANVLAKSSAAQNRARESQEA